MGSSSSICTENIKQIEFLQKPLALLLGFLRRRSLFYKELKLQIHSQALPLAHVNSFYGTLTHGSNSKRSKTQSQTKFRKRSKCFIKHSSLHTKTTSARTNTMDIPGVPIVGQHNEPDWDP